MAMDGLALCAAVRELSKLEGGKIDKVQQPEKDMLLFTVRSDRTNSRLLVNLHAETGRMQLTTQAYDNPANAPAFCMLLRRHLIGGRIERIEQNGADRACTFFIAARNELMDDVRLRLVVELMGKHANVILVGGDDKILDCLRHVSPSETSTRVLMPGFAYHDAPASQKQNPFKASSSQFANVLATVAPVRSMTDTFEGLSKASADALIATFPDAAALERFFDGFAQGRFAPAIVYDTLGEPLALFPFTPSGLGARTATFPCMSAALDAFYAERDACLRIRRHGAALRRTVENALGRAQNKRRSFLEAIEGGASREALRLNGELILANLHLARPGLSQLIVPNYFVDPPAPCTVPLDPSLSLQLNAKRYFKLYRKGKLASEYASAQLCAVSDEIAYLEGQLENIALCRTLRELNEIREELVAERFIKPDQKKAAKPRQSAPSEPMRFRSSDGFDIYVGRNNRQNDQLTMKLAKPDNLWLHAKNIPGSHVIVDCSGVLPAQTLLEAATLAACFSGGKAASTVEVDYTLRRNIKKPSGARPGMVVYSTNKTIAVSPDSAMIERLTSAR